MNCRREDSLIITIRSGGQSGVDRGALDAARAAGVPVAGWCPAGGWAEDYPASPGVLVEYPELTETPSPQTGERTEWNVRDGDVTVIVVDEIHRSPGTDLTATFAQRWGRPYLLVDNGRIRSGGAAPFVTTWLRAQGNELEVNVAGPRASEWTSAYDAAYSLVREILATSPGAGPHCL